MDENWFSAKPDNDSDPLLRKNLVETIGPNKDWSYEKFRNVMVTLAETQMSLPGVSVPESIGLVNSEGKGLYPIFMDMAEKTKQTGNEFGTFTMARFSTRTFVTGRPQEQGNTGGHIKLKLPSENPQDYMPVILSHTHPLKLNGLSYTFGHGFSGTDYNTFLSTELLKGSFMIYGEQIFLTLKTGSTARMPTPRGLAGGRRRVMSADTIKRIVTEARKDFITGDPSKIHREVVDFNREVCSLTGLALFTNKGKDKSVLERVKVV